MEKLCQFFVYFEPYLAVSVDVMDRQDLICTDAAWAVRLTMWLNLLGGMCDAKSWTEVVVGINRWRCVWSLACGLVLWLHLSWLYLITCRIEVSHSCCKTIWLHYVRYCCLLRLTLRSTAQCCLPLWASVDDDWSALILDCWLSNHLVEAIIAVWVGNLVHGILLLLLFYMVQDLHWLFSFSLFLYLWVPSWVTEVNDLLYWREYLLLCFFCE